MAYCRECGSEINEKAVICIYCGCAANNQSPKNINNNNESHLSHMVYVITGLFFGWFGLHNFLAGYNKKAICQIVLSIFTYFIGGWIWALFDICNVKTDSEGKLFSKP